MKVLIFGAGGVGSVVGAFLARTGHGVSLLGRPWHLDVVAKQGLSITGIWGDYRMKAFDLYTQVTEVQKKDIPWDMIILTVKSFDTEKAIQDIIPLLKDHTMLLSLQNGLGNIEKIIGGGVKPENFIAGRLIFGVETTPGIAKVTVNADSVRVGALPGVTTRLSPFQTAQTLNTAKIPTEAVPDILTYIWAKVIYNCALNPICTMHEMPYGKILERDETWQAMDRIIDECYAVGHKKGILLNPPTADAFKDLMRKKLIPSTAAHHPSMLQDIRRGKRTDIDALNGAIVLYGRELDIPTPENDLWASKIRSLK